MVLVFTDGNAPQQVVDTLQSFVGGALFENISTAINRLEELGLEGGDIHQYCTIVKVHN